MKKHIIPILFLLSTLVLSACEEVIDVDLAEANPVLVVDAQMDAEQSLVEVRLTRSGSYFDGNPVSAVLGAAVSIESEGQTVVLADAQSQGLYTGNITVSPGDEVRLTIVDGADTYTSTTTVPVEVKPDSLTTEYFPPNSFFDGGSIVRISFTDPGTSVNHYRVILFANGEAYEGSGNIIAENDELVNGEYVDYPVFLDFFQPGDSVTIILQSITEATYDYLLTLQDITLNQGGGSTAAPANPISNVEGGALGLFDVHYADTLSIIVPVP